MPTPDSYRLPPVHLDVVGSPWLADAAVASWRVERELVGSTLPGQVRHRSGFSIGSASATVTKAGKLLTPWSTDPATQVVNGDRARLVAAVDPDQVVLDDCSSTTGWQLIGTSLTSDGSSIFLEGPDPAASPPDRSLLRRQIYVSMGSYSLISVDYETSHPFYVTADGVELVPIRSVTGENGVTTTDYAVPASFYYLDFIIDDEPGPTLITMHELRQVRDGVELGSWIVDKSGGSLLGSGVDVDLLEAQYAARKPDARLAPINYAFEGSDAVSVVAQAASLAGYHAVPPPSDLAIMAAPLVGGWDAPTLNPSRPTTLLGETPNGWDSEMMGVPAMAPGGVAILSRSNTDAFFERQASGQFTYITLNMDGVAAIWNESFDLGWAIEVDAVAGTIRCTNHYNGFVDPVVWSTPVVFSTGDDPTWPLRVQLVLQRFVSGDGSPEDPWLPTEFKVWARSAWGLDWSAPTISTEPSPGGAGQVVDQITFDGGRNFWGNTPGLGSRLGGIQVANAALAELFRPPTAELDVMGGSQAAAWVPPGMDVWTAIQDQCAAWGAAAIVGNDGPFRLLTRDDLSGVGVPGTPVAVGVEWTDLPWALDTADTADRLVVSYNPPAFRERNTDTLWDPVAWEADEVISIPANSSIVVKAVLDRYAEGIHAGPGVGLYRDPTELPTPNPDPAYQSSFSYYANPEGAGSQETSGLTFWSEVISATEVHWHWINLTGITLYLVDANGDPHFTIRASRVATFDESRVVERGLPADQARNPLTIDLGYHVQNAQDAVDLTDFYWARLNRPKWRASSVRCRLDWDHDLGRIIAPSHARTGLEEKALVTKVSYEGQPGEYAQTVDLVLLPPTWADFDLAWAGQTWTAFDAAWSAATWADFDQDPLSTTGGA